MEGTLLMVKEESADKDEGIVLVRRKGKDESGGGE